MDRRVSFGTIHIVEWLRRGNPTTGEGADRPTGHETYLELKSLLDTVEPRVEVDFHAVSSSAGFLACLRSIEDDFHVSGRVPLLQIETHGDEAGIGISDIDGLTWPELMKALTPLNQATGVRLPVVLAACHGIWGIKMSQPMERSPFLFLVGPNRIVSPGEVVRGMRAFYQGIFRHKDGTRAMQMLNSIVDPDRATFAIFTAEKLFRDVWDTYFEMTSTETQIAARVERAVAVAQRSQSPAELARFRASMRDYILDYEARFEESRRHFFFVDLYPANDARFNLVLQPAESSSGTADA